jgi:hypothetical protein
MLFILMTSLVMLVGVEDEGLAICLSLRFSDTGSGIWEITFLMGI